ncbi:hypothetical protein DUI87_04489 [Hirundo rustica rustica]|uniref:Uncharacterized protein n=1 Tax=Hirundo rustica rustica TaxID=333673 RepID=A0A3M0KZN2_HIRRU|nr:hypothetical protein DUI87_04489 [Hirundo rustica rustica]
MASKNKRQTRKASSEYLVVKMEMVVHPGENYGDVQFWGSSAEPVAADKTFEQDLNFALVCGMVVEFHGNEINDS